MPEITQKQMVEWLKNILSEFEGHKSIRNYAIWKVGQYDLKIIRAILAALEERRALLEVLPSFVDDEPCQFDHHGYCQTHNLSLESGECPMPTLRRILAGQPALEPVTEEFVEKWAKFLEDAPNYDACHDKEKGARRFIEPLKSMLREAGVAGKEE